MGSTYRPEGVKVANFAEECARSNNKETDPQSPDNTTKDGHNFMAEQLQRGGPRLTRYSQRREAMRGRMGLPGGRI